MNQYYRERGGNPAGLPAVVIGLEKDARGISSGGTFFFAERTGLEIVTDDSDHEALHQFFPEIRGNGRQNASDFIVLNGVAGTPGHQQWEILFSHSGTPAVSDLRRAIDSVQAPVIVRVPEPPALTVGVDGAELVLAIQGEADVAYAVQGSMDLRDWQDQLSIPAGGAQREVRVPLAKMAKSQFFRVVAR